MRAPLVGSLGSPWTGSSCGPHCFFRCVHPVHWTASPALLAGPTRHSDRSTDPVHALRSPPTGGHRTMAASPHGRRAPTPLPVACPSPARASSSPGRNPVPLHSPAPSPSLTLCLSPEPSHSLCSSPCRHRRRGLELTPGPHRPSPSKTPPRRPAPSTAPPVPHILGRRPLSTERHFATEASAFELTVAGLLRLSSSPIQVVGEFPALPSLYPATSGEPLRPAGRIGRARRRLLPRSRGGRRLRRKTAILRFRPRVYMIFRFTPMYCAMCLTVLTI